MYLDWTAEQKALSGAAQRFAAEALAGRAATGFDHEGWRLCAAHGALQSRAALDMVAVLEALGRGGADRGLLFAMGAHLFGCCIALARHGDSPQQAAWSARLADGRSIAALAVTEPAGGSSWRNLTTRFNDGAGGWRLTGEKLYVTNGVQADLFLVLAMQTPSFGALGTTMLLLERNTPGLTVEPLQPTVGMRGAPMARVRFDCRVPASVVLGSPHTGWQVFSTAMRWERACILAGFVGAARRDVEVCARYLEQRGVLAHQAAQHRLARVTTRLNAAAWLIYRAAWLLDQGQDDDVAAAEAKLVASETLRDVSVELFSLLGGAGWLDESGVGTALQDVLGTLTASGTSEALLNLMAMPLRPA